MNTKHFLIAAILLMLPAGLAWTQQADIETGTGTGVQSVRIAVPLFETSSADPQVRRLTEIFNQVLWDDLEFAGPLILASRSFYPAGSHTRPADIRAAEWTRPGIDAQFITFGSTATAGNNFSVVGRLWDLKVDQSQEMLASSYESEASEAGVRILAHTLADDIVARLGFGRGVTRTKITYVCERAPGVKEICVMDYDGYASYPLTSLGSLALTPSFSPDGERVAFMAYRGPTTNIEIMSRVDRQPYPFERFTGTNTTPSWSPDNSRIAFASSKDSNDGTEIYVADWNGRNARRLTFRGGVDISPVWNPRTGRELAFVSDRSGTPQIFVMDIDGANVQRIVVEGGEAQNPSWSPDGRFIAFAWRRPQASFFDIYLHDLATGVSHQLTSNARNNERPTWSPDGKRLAFESDRGGTPQIYSMLANGQKVRQLTRTGRNQGPAWSGYIQ